MIHLLKLKKYIFYLFAISILLSQVNFAILQTPGNNGSSNNLTTKSTDGVVINSPFGQPVTTKISSYTNTSPIVIKSNTDLQSYASSGNGTQSNPYIIENLRIVNSSANTNCIDIENTYNYFIVRNNYISCIGSGSNGIFLQTVTSGTATIENNTFIRNGKAGIYVSNSNYINISSNTFLNNQNYGIYFFSTGYNSIIDNNTFSGQANTTNSAYGAIYLISNNVIISNNNFTGNYNGVYISSGSTNNSIIGNYISNSSYFGLYVTGSKTIIKNNLFTKNPNNAVWIANSVNNTIRDNTFDNNPVTPLWISSYGQYNTIINNSFTNNGEYGLWLSSYGNGNIIDRNYFYNNTQGGITVSSGADNNSITLNTMINNGYGIYGFPTHSIITDNYIENCSSYGFYFNNMLNDTIKNNFLYKGVSEGIYINSATNVTITNNTVIGFGSYAIHVYDTNPNKIFLNNFLNNNNGLNQVYSLSNVDTWDNGTAGNFWLDYTGKDSNSDGIGDTAYAFTSSGQDNYPLMIWYGTKIAPQLLISPSSNTYEEGLTINLTWKPIDDNPNQYQIYVDNTPNSSGSFTSRSNISISLSGLLVGNHNVTITLTDMDNLISSKTIFLNVVDTTPPFVIGLTNYTYNETTTGHTLNWNVTDLNPGSYEIILDGVTSQNGTWTSGSTIYYSIDGLLKGIYNVTISVNDSYNNMAINTTMVSVYDGTHPIVSHPTNITFEYGYPTGNLTWTAMDTYAYNYTIYLNGTLYETGNWTTGLPISITLDYLIPGTFNYTIIVMDTSNLTARNIVFVTVTPDVTAPVVNHPSDSTIPYGTVGNIIQWNATDLHPNNYTIYKNNVITNIGFWNNATQVIVSLDSLQPGQYNFTVVFYDTNNNSATDTVLVNILLTTSLAINSPNNISFQEGLSNYSLNWIVLSNSSWSYTLLRNSSVVQTGNGLNNGSITYNLISLSVGTYNYTVVVNTASNTVADSIFVYVLAKPSVYYVAINSPNDISYQEGLSNYSLSWAVISNGTWSYTIVSNNSVVQSGGGVNNASIVYNLISLPAGSYNFTVLVNTSNLYINDTIFVHVIDKTAPSVDQPTNLSFIEGTGSYFLLWNATDLHPGSYIIYENGSVLTIGTWTNSNSISLDISNFVTGNYNITIVVFDSSNNSITSTVYVTVINSPISNPSSTTISSTSHSTTPQSSGASNSVSSSSSGSSSSSSTQNKTTVTSTNLNGLEIILFIAFTAVYLRRKYNQK